MSVIQPNLTNTMKTQPDQYASAITPSAPVSEGKGFFTGMFNKAAKLSLTNIFNYKSIGIGLVAGASVSFAVKTTMLSLFAAADVTSFGAVSASAAVAGIATGVTRKLIDRHYAKKRGEEVGAFWTWKNAGTMLLQGTAGAAFGGVFALYGDQIWGTAAKLLAPVLQPLAPIGGFFAKLLAPVTGLFGSVSAPAPAPAPTAPVAAFVPPVALEDVVMAPAELPQPSFEVPELPPTLETALPVMDAPPEVSMSEFAAKAAPEINVADVAAKMDIPLPEDMPVPEFDVPAAAQIQPTLEDAVPAPAAPDASVILATPSALERAVDLIKGQKNVSPYIQQRLAAALEGNAQAIKDIGHALYNAQGLPANKQLAIDLFRDAADQGNMQGKIAYAYATSAPAPVSAPVAHIAPRPVVPASVSAPASIQSAPVVEMPKAVAVPPVAPAPAAPIAPQMQTIAPGVSISPDMNCVATIDPATNATNINCTVKGAVAVKVGDTITISNPVSPMFGPRR